jgi:putative ABC transport system permease protein
MNVYIFSCVALFVLVIACFNFINLTTALSMNRAKEVGIRKVVGAAKRQLTFQFLFDAVLLSILAFLCALSMCTLLLPLFNDLSGKIIAPGIFHEPRYIGWLFAGAVLIGLLSGIYPAFVLSGFRPVSSLKGRFASGSKGIVLRRVLVIGQFSISIALIVSTLVVYTQLDYMRNHSPGFKKDHRLVIDFQFDGRITNHREAVKHQLSSLQGAGMVSMSSGIPGRANHTFTTHIENSEKEIPELQWNAYFVDHDFLTQYGIKVIAGRGFSREFPADSTDALLINETAARSLGYVNPQDAVGKPFTQLRRQGYIIGVVNDFHYHSFQEKVQPLTFALGSGFLTFLTMDIASSDTRELVHAVGNAWQKIAPGMPLIYFFGDEAYNAQYASEERFGKLFLCLAVIAVFVSCLGLSGLTAFSIAQRTKEIGIRKILGSSIAQVVSLLTKDFIKLIALSILAGSPLAWFGMRQWLRDFAYRIDLSWWMFLTAGIIVIVIAFATISILAIKAARTNPVNSLRSE